MAEKKNAKTAFVVIGWNNKKLLKDCFNSINNQTYPNKKIIYVDNNSSDDSVGWVKQHYPDAIVLAQSKNTGFAKGNNIGIKEALKDPDVQYIGLLNSDARLDASWTEKIVEFADVKPKGACFQGVTLDYYKREVIDSTHIYISRNGQGTQGNWRYYYTGELGPKKVFGVNAAACAISRKFIEAQPFVELFDERMYMYLEDIDLAARVTVMGWDNYLVPGAKAYHIGSASANSRSSTFSLYMTFRNNSGMLFKNFSWRMLVRILPKLIKGDIDTVRTLWRRNQKSGIWQVLKGRLVGFIRLPLFLGKRTKMHKHRQVNPDYLWILMREGY